VCVLGLSSADVPAAGLVIRNGVKLIQGHAVVGVDQ
jgi:hypothetical protein